MDREARIEAYIDREISKMSVKDMERIIGDQMEENLRYLKDDDLNAIIGE